MLGLYSDCMDITAVLSIGCSFIPGGVFFLDSKMDLFLPPYFFDQQSDLKTNSTRIDFVYPFFHQQFR